MSGVVDSALAMNLKDRVALVAGGTGTLGIAIAQSLRPTAGSV